MACLVKTDFWQRLWGQLHSYLLMAYDASAAPGCRKECMVTEEMVREDFAQRRREKQAAHDVGNS